MLNVSVTSSTKEQLEQLCNKMIDNSQDFTDSVYITIEQREKLLDYHRKLQEQLSEIVNIISNTNDIGISLKNDVLPLTIQSIQELARDFRKYVNKFFRFCIFKSLFLSILVRTNGNISFIGIFSNP